MNGRMDGCRHEGGDRGRLEDEGEKEGGNGSVGVDDDDLRCTDFSGEFGFVKRRL